MKQKFNLGKLINERQQADREAAKETTEEQPVKKPTDPKADLARSKQLLESARTIAESITNPWKQYRSLQESNPRAAGVFWRKNKAAIMACSNNQ